MSSTLKSPKSKDKGRVCIFCEEGNVSEDTFGKLISRGGVTAHYFCMLFSSGLSQNGKSEKQGILGFLQTDIIKEVKRGGRLKCSYCKRNGATIGCVIRNCKKMFHLGCGRKNGTLHQYFGTFSSFCPAHREQQDVPSDDDPNIVCSICMNTVPAKPGNDTIRAPCCNKYWYHRECVQRYATSAGLYFFKCPLCNNKDDFQNEMLTMGIYIPDQDASWEKEPHAFRELLERYGHCDAPVCRCAEGRKYDKEGSKWEIILCDFCGSHGAHVACNHLEKQGKHDICRGCKEVDERTREEEYLLHSPPNKKKSLELLQLELASSPESSKGSSPYPGPSNSMRKSGLPKSPTQNDTQKAGAKKGKRTAGSESRQSLPNAKKSRRSSKASATVTSASARSRNLEALSSSMSSLSSDDSSDDDVPLSVQRSKLQKMRLENAWDVMRRRKLESGRKNAEKKEKKKNDETDKGTEAKGKKGKGKRTESSSANTFNVEDSDSDFVEIKSRIVREGKEKKEVSSRRLSLAVTKAEKEIHGGEDRGKENSRLSLCPGTSTVSCSSKSKQKKGKRESVEKDRAQTSLTNWFKPKATEENSKNENNICLSLSEQNLRRTPRKGNRKPVVMEWKGKQLLIKSPRVVLKRSKNGKFMKMKPKCLEIDMTDSKGCLDWKKDIDLLSNLESNIRVTRKMIGIDEIEEKHFSKKEKHTNGKVNSSRNIASLQTLETKACNPNEKLVKNKTQASNEALNVEVKTGILNSVQKDDKINFEFGYKADCDVNIDKTQNITDSPAKNLRARNGKDTTNIKLGNQFYHQSSQQCNDSDSPAKGLRSRPQKEKRKPIATGDTDICSENGFETENELTPLMQTQNNFNFTIVKDKSSTDKKQSSRINSPIIQVKNSFEFGSVIVMNDSFDKREFVNGNDAKTNHENLEQFKMNKPSLVSDSPAKNLRKRSHQTDVAREISMKKIDSDSDSSVNNDHLERLKRYRPKVPFMNTGSVSASTCNDGKTDENKKEALKESRAYTVKNVNKLSQQMKQYPNLYWHLEGTRQVLSDNNNTSAGICDIGCENTCPNPQAPSAQDKVKSAQGSDYSSILGEKINELCDKLPISVSELYSANKLGKVVNNQSEADQESQKSILNEMKNDQGVKLRSSPRSVNKVSATTRKNVRTADVELHKASLDPVHKNADDRKYAFLDNGDESQIIVIEDSPAMKLRNSPRSVRKVSSTSHKNSHMSDRTSMSEYYGSCLKSDVKEGVKVEDMSDIEGYIDNDSDIIEIPMLGNVM